MMLRGQKMAGDKTEALADLFGCLLCVTCCSGPIPPPALSLCHECTNIRIWHNGGHALLNYKLLHLLGTIWQQCCPPPLLHWRPLPRPSKVQLPGHYCKDLKICIITLKGQTTRAREGICYK